MASLFTPFTLKGVTLKNRIAVSPTCQYSADEGLINDWHVAHLTGLAHGGASLVIAEATAVSPEGRITPGCAGIWTNGQGEALARRGGGDQGGRSRARYSAGARRPQGQRQPALGGRRSHPRWRSPRLGDPRAVRHRVGPCLAKVPRAMTLADIDRVKGDFVLAVKRAHKAGFE